MTPPPAGDVPWWRGATIYQIYPRSFQDSNGDGIGDLPGILRRLDYVADLGVDAVWISPFFRSPMKDFGYDVSDHCAVDPIFGTLADFDALIAKAHRLGLRVVIDQVLNHTSDRHAWFVESRASRDNPKADWYVWADPRRDGSPPNNWLSVFGGVAWHWEPRRRQYFLHNFLASQPDLNFHCEAVRAAVIESIRFWLDRGVDGFRLDAVNYYFHDPQLRDNPPARDPGDSEQPAVNPYALQRHLHDKSQPELLPFLQQLRRLFDRYPSIMTLGEIGDGARSLELMAAYTGGGDKLDTCYATDFLRGRFEPGYFRTTLTRFEVGAGDGWPCWAFSNHDSVRQATRWLDAVPDRDRLARLAAQLLLSLRGTICLYQGEELGLPEAELQREQLVDPYGIEFWPEYPGRDGCRTPMPWQSDAPAGGFSDGVPWLPLPAAHRALAVDRSDAEGAASLRALYRKMLALRRAEPALRLGAIRFLAAPPPVLALVREGDPAEPPGQARAAALLCVCNFGAAPVRFSPAGQRLAALPGAPGRPPAADALVIDGYDAGFARLLP
ncbi:MAG: alpha-amylase family glycosyl hydrolase [Lautropia sp.]